MKFLDAGYAASASGIYELSSGTGAVTVSSSGPVSATGTASSGVTVQNTTTATGDVTVQAAALSGGTYGIRAFNRGSGALQVTTTGLVTGTTDTACLGGTSAPRRPT